MEALLEVRNIIVKYGDFIALDGISLNIQKKELRILIGPNGAGKTTLLDVISGAVKPSSGDIYWKGIKINEHSPHKRARMGIIKKFQAPSVVEGLTVLENLMIASMKKSFPWDWSKDEQEKVEAVLDAVGLYKRKHTLAKELSYGERQWLEIGMVMVSPGELILLDEPAIGMTVKDVHRLIDVVLPYLVEHSSVIIVDHNMDFLKEISKKFEAKVTFMHQGRILKTGTFDEIRLDDEVQRVYLGVD